MTERTYETSLGTIHYWVSHEGQSQDLTLVFLPGLTADHRLFEKQVRFFEGKYPLLVWDAPGHGASRPFTLSFDLMDKARWVEEILLQEGVTDPVIIGQSMGGYVGQVYAQFFPERLRGYIAIDSAPIQRAYMTAPEIWMLRHTELMYRLYPWRALLKAGSEGVASSAYGRELMRKMMMDYEGNQKGYAQLSGHGFRILAEAIEADLPYEIPCPALLICGEEDHAGFCLRYNRAWHEKTEIPILWIPGAGHNSNTDEPELVNRTILEFVKGLQAFKAG
ncbi:MAG: alpha/beta hydrolase [Blautia sp.]|nr:alpha/beta hydrolase [Blautia sp.]